MSSGRPDRDGRPASAGPRAARATKTLTFCCSLLAAAAFINWYQPPRALARAPFVTDSAFGVLASHTEVAPTAFGRSGAVRIAFAMPGELLDYPVTVPHDTIALRYAWRRVTDSALVDSAASFTGDSVVAPATPGFYHLTLLHGADEHVVNALTLAVLVPFDEKQGPVLDGYRIGTYRAERRPRAPTPPEGFLKVMPQEVDLPLSTHLRLGDFLSHDGQVTWPRFAALDPRVLDKLELVLERLSAALGGRDVQVDLEVHSGFRTPAYNRHVSRAADDSRHQYGDAVDVAIDADGNGRIDRRDARLVAAAVDSVEAAYPDLVGGLGVYTSRRYRHPYVHIDARGSRVRWRG